MKREPWDEDLLARFRRVIAYRGVEAVAADIPVDRVTIYRYIHGKIQRPSLAVRAKIIELVRDHDKDTKCPQP